MKIGLVVPHYYPDITGGIEWYAFNISQELANSRNNDIYIFTQLTKKANQKIELIGKVKVRRLKSYGFFYRLKFWPALAKELKKYNLDILISFDYAQPQCWQTLIFGKKNNIPVLTLLYDIQSQKKPRHPIKQFLLDIFDQFFAKYIFKKSNLVLLRTPAPYNWLKSLKVDINKTRITPSGITDRELKPGNRKNFENKFKIKNNIILFLGRIREQKGIFLLLDAFIDIKKEIPTAKLIYIGTDDKEYDGLEFTSKLKKEIKDRNIQDVYILGPIYDDLKNDALAACSILTLPSSYEAFGQVFIQAMAQKKPVIGTNTGGVPYVIDHNKNGFLIALSDKKSLTKYIIRLLKDKNLQESMGKLGKEKVKKYHYKLLAKNLEKILKNLL